MGWKNLPIWLKFGIIFAVLDILVILLFIILGFINQNLGYFIYLCIIQGIGCFILAFLAKTPLNIIGSFIGFISGIIMWFFVGSLIGWIYGKIKSRKQENSSPI